MINIDSIVRPNILNLKPYSSARNEYKGKEGIFLDANENPYGALNRYPDPKQGKLKNRLSELKGISSDKIFIGNGSDEIIDLAFRIFCTPETDKALTFSPTYGMYNVSAAINNVELLKTPLTKDFQIDLEKVKKYLNDKNLKLIFICSPNNPTGNILDRNTIEYILQNFKGIVIVDEAYIDFSGSESLMSLVDTYNNLIVSQTMSKAWGLAAIRVGIAYANTNIIRLYNKVKPPYNISKLNQDAALSALNKYNDFTDNVQLIKSEKGRLIPLLNDMNVVKKIYPSDANFLLVEVNDANSLYNLLIEEKIIIRNRNTLVPNCLRITIGTPEENNRLISTLKNVG